MMDGSSAITPDDAPTIPGLAFYRFRGAADLPGIADVMSASFAADGSPARITTEDLANVYAHPVNWDPSRDSLLIEVDDALIGCANTEWQEESDSNCLHMINLHLVSEWRGHGLELAVQRYMEHRARGAVDKEAECTCHWFASRVPETWQARVELLLSLGYSPARYYFEMQRQLDDELPETGFPAGLELRSPLPEHYRAIWEAGEECFRDQADYFIPSEESFQAWVEEPDPDPSLWLVAWDGDQVAGAAINTAHQGVWGETDDLFVRRPWRRRGLGRALLVGSLHLFRARGLTTAGLGVDAENLSGALDLYEGVGYRQYQRVVLYRKLM